MTLDADSGKAERGRRRRPKQDRTQIEPTWGLAEIRWLVSSRWDEVFCFALEQNVVRERAYACWEWERIVSWPWEETLAVLVPYHGGDSLVGSAWEDLLRKNRIFPSPQGPKLRERARAKLARQAEAIKANRPVADCVATMLGRDLTAAERKLCPGKICGLYDEMIAEAAVQYGLRLVDVEGYYWSWVRASLQRGLSLFDRVLEALRMDQVPDDDDVRQLTLGETLVTAVRLRRAETGNSAVAYRTIASPFWPEFCEGSPPDFEVPGRLLAPATLEVMNAFESYFRERGPLFIITCRNPACAKRFYSRQKRAVACPKKPHERVTSPCKRKWDNFADWLEGHGHDPRVDWQKETLKKEYLGLPTRRRPR